ncbi:MAG TPA: hypothetical protein VNJ52_13730 [Patescibacteria group bacterium]|nr:hypothetical protein [Patescibacteria group bacterium]
MRLRAAIGALLETTAVLLVVSLLASPALAQNIRGTHAAPGQLPALPSLAPLPATPAPPLEQPLDPPPIVVPYRLSPGQQRAWLLLGLAEHGAAFFDARTTRDAMTHYQELDPLLRPFAHSAALYPVMQIAPAGLDWLAIRMATSRHRWLRRIWWLPQTAAAAGLLWSGVHNLRLPGPAPR